MNNNVINPIRIKRIDKELPIPVRAHTGDAGVDLYSTETCVIHPGERALIGTGIAIALPLGTVGLIHPRSGRALREGLGMVNAPGTIDAGYRGELKVCLINLELFDFTEADELDDTLRGDQGYGSTGID